MCTQYSYLNLSHFMHLLLYHSAPSFALNYLKKHYNYQYVNK